MERGGFFNHQIFKTNHMHGYSGKLRNAMAQRPLNLCIYGTSISMERRGSELKKHENLTRNKITFQNRYIDGSGSLINFPNNTRKDSTDYYATSIPTAMSSLEKIFFLNREQIGHMHPIKLRPIQKFIEALKEEESIKLKIKSISESSVSINEKQGKNSLQKNVLNNLKIAKREEADSKSQFSIEFDHSPGNLISSPKKYSKRERLEQMLSDRNQFELNGSSQIIHFDECLSAKERYKNIPAKVNSFNHKYKPTVPKYKTKIKEISVKIYSSNKTIKPKPMDAKPVPNPSILSRQIKHAKSKIDCHNPDIFKQKILSKMIREKSKETGVKYDAFDVLAMKGSFNTIKKLERLMKKEFKRKQKLYLKKGD